MKPHSLDLRKAGNPPGAFPFSLREIWRAMSDVHAADTVMEDIVRDIDEIAFQTDVLALRGKAADEVFALRSQAQELRAVTDKLGTLVGTLVEAELAERRRRGIAATAKAVVLRERLERGRHGSLGLHVSPTSAQKPPARTVRPVSEKRVSDFPSIPFGVE